MFEPDVPYSSEELQLMRRLIVASGSEVGVWAQRTRRSAEFVRALSPSQADVIAEQAIAIAGEPDDLGTGDEIAEAEAIFQDVPPDERHKQLWRLLLEVRRRHYPSQE